MFLNKTKQTGNGLNFIFDIANHVAEIVDTVLLLIRVFFCLVVDWLVQISSSVPYSGQLLLLNAFK